MDNKQLINKIKSLLKIANLSQETTTRLLAQLETSTDQQLKKLHDILMQHVHANIYIDSLEELGRDDRLLDNDDVDKYIDKFDKKLSEIDSQISSDSEIDKIRQELTQLTQKPG